MMFRPIGPLIAFVMACCIVQSHSASFLSTQAKTRTIGASDVENSIAQFTGDALARIEKELSTMYAALPKNVHGNLDPSTSSYALHRYFVQKYGWNMEGLDPAQLQNVSQQAIVMQDRAPALIQSMLERKVSRKGMGLKEVAIFAGVLTDLILREVAGSFHAVWDSQGLSLNLPVTEKEADDAVKLYMMFFIMEEDIRGHIDDESLAEVEAHVRDIYPEWDNTVLWVDDHRSTLKWRRSLNNPFPQQLHNFDTEVTFTQDVLHHFSSYQRFSCATLKNDLSEMEHQGSGRVLLSRFYKGALKGDWTFGESQDYLRHLGVLDESDLAAPTVVIPNYMNSKTNCLVSTGFYSLCCADECEGLMQHLEAKVGAPRAQPAEIADMVSQLPSDTVDAPRNLSDSLLQRLDEVASVNGGSVPLHGRLFAQWMHHAYPRECMQPLVERRTTSILSGKEWLAIHGPTSLEATADQLQFHVDKIEEQQAKDMFIPWVAKEELIAEHEFGAVPPSWCLLSARTLAAVMVIASFAAALLRLLPSKGDGKVASVMV